MKTFILNTAGILLLSLLLVQCTKDAPLDTSEDVEFVKIIKDSEYAPAKCQGGSFKTKTLNIPNVIPSTLNGMTPAQLLAAIGWGGAGTDLCKGTCTTGICKPTSIESGSTSDLQFETDNDTGLIKDAKWRNSGVDPAAAVVKIKADSCDCLA